MVLIFICAEHVNLDNEVNMAFGIQFRNINHDDSFRVLPVGRDIGQCAIVVEHVFLEGFLVVHIDVEGIGVRVLVVDEFRDIASDDIQVANVSGSAGRSIDCAAEPEKTARREDEQSGKR